MLFKFIIFLRPCLTRNLVNLIFLRTKSIVNQGVKLKITLTIRSNKVEFSIRHNASVFRFKFNLPIPISNLNFTEK